MTTAEKMATSVWGVILARFISPALLGVAIAMGGFIANGIFTRMDVMTTAQATLAAQLTEQSMRIAAIEARRDIMSKVRDDDFADLKTAFDTLSNQMFTLQSKFETANTTVAALTAKVDILLTKLSASDMVPADRKVQ